MAHQAQIEYLTKLSNSSTLKNFFGKGASQNLRVLDIGSYDVNGNNKRFFNLESVESLIGCDIIEGPNVDVVSCGHELTYEDGFFDMIISCECFEHDMHYKKTLQNIVRMLSPGGLFVFTCATTGRPEHGTRRTTPRDSPGTCSISEWSDYYKNLTSLYRPSSSPHIPLRLKDVLKI